MSETTKEAPKKRGRKPGTKMTPKIRLKHSPKTAREDFLKKFKELSDIGFYGMDDFAKEIVNYLWSNPEITFHVTDFNESRLDNANREYAQRSFSMYRWHTYSESDFIEYPCVDTIIVSKDAKEMVMKRPNPYKINLIVLEEME